MASRPNLALAFSRLETNSPHTNCTVGEFLEDVVFAVPQTPASRRDSEKPAGIERNDYRGSTEPVDSRRHGNILTRL